jgi:hypothetical protein
MSRNSDKGYDAFGVTMARFAELLSDYADRRVVDRTGLSGEFDIHLNLSPSDLGHPAMNASDDDAKFSRDPAEIFARVLRETTPQNCHRRVMVEGVEALTNGSPIDGVAARSLTRELAVHDEVLKDPEHPHVFGFGLQAPLLPHAELGFKQFGAPGFVKLPKNSMWAGQDHPSLPSEDSRAACGVRGNYRAFPATYPRHASSMPSVEGKLVGNCEGKGGRKWGVAANDFWRLSQRLLMLLPIGGQ